MENGKWNRPSPRGGRLQQESRDLALPWIPAGVHPDGGQGGNDSLGLGSGLASYTRTRNFEIEGMDREKQREADCRGRPASPVGCAELPRNGHNGQKVLLESMISCLMTEYYG
jgi:hypothetical protein